MAHTEFYGIQSTHSHPSNNHIFQQLLPLIRPPASLLASQMFPFHFSAVFHANYPCNLSPTGRRPGNNGEQHKNAIGNEASNGRKHWEENEQLKRELKRENNHKWKWCDKRGGHNFHLKQFAGPTVEQSGKIKSFCVVGRLTAHQQANNRFNGWQHLFAGWCRGIAALSCPHPSIHHRWFSFPNCHCSFVCAAIISIFGRKKSKLKTKKQFPSVPFALPPSICNAFLLPPLLSFSPLSPHFLHFVVCMLLP